jgi:hypothetical protein
MQAYKITYANGETSFADSLEQGRQIALTEVRKNHPHAFIGASGKIHYDHTQFAKTAAVEPRSRLTYWDANREEYVNHWDATCVRSEDGRVFGPEYRETWKLADGRLLDITRHKDRGDLGTNVKIRKR